MRRITRVRLLLPHHRRPDQGRVSYPQFMPLLGEHSFKPLGVTRGFYPYSSATWKCGVKRLGLARLMLQSALDDLSRRGIQHCNLLKARVKITSDNQHLRLLSS